MRTLMFVIFLCLVSNSVFAASFETGMDAYERGDYTVAFREFKTRAGAGDPDSQYMLGRLYARGAGVIQDYIQAHKWYNLASSRGHSKAADARDNIAKQMTAKQVARAQAQARAWQPEGAMVPEEPGEAPVSRSIIAAIQQSLNALGYDAGVGDGVMGSKTRRAIRRYQRDHGLQPNGQPSRALLDHLSKTRAEGPPVDIVAPQPTWPWQRLLVHDTFRDGNYTANPTWTVVSGKFQVEKGFGLRSVQEALSRPQAQDLPSAILDMVMKEVVQSQVGPPGTKAEIYLGRNIDNAFAIKLKLTARQVSGPLAFGPFQGGQRASGYRLYFIPGATRALELRRLTRSGTSVVQVSQRPLNLQYNREHILLWTRDKNGQMTVSVDGQEVFRVTDRGFSDPFHGFNFIDHGGDYILGEILIQVAD